MSRSEQPVFANFKKNFDVARQNKLLFDSNGSIGGFYDFTSLSKLNLETGVYWASRLIQGHKKLGRQVFVEVGNHNRLSPFETALAFPNTTVIGVESATITWDPSTIQKLEGRWNNSLVTLFQFDVEDLIEKGLEVDRVQIVAPDPWSEKKLLESIFTLVRPGGEIVVPIDPFVVAEYYKGRDDFDPEETAREFALRHNQFEARVEYLTLKSIKKRFGFSDSKYLERNGMPDIPTIVATRKL